MWSVAVEEQFYLFWPWLVLRLNKALPWVFVGIIVVINGFDLLKPDGSALAKYLTMLAYNTRFDMMALGGLMAWGVVRYRSFMERTVGHPAVAWLAVACLFLLFFVGRQPLPVSLCFAFIIGHLAMKGRRVRALALLRRAGDISYGLYMYHILVIYFAMAFLQAVARPYGQQIWYQFALYALVLGGTWGVAWLSYRFFETPFLKMKHRLEKIKTPVEAP